MLIYDDSYRFAYLCTCFMHDQANAFLQFKSEIYLNASLIFCGGCDKNKDP
jgi:hypothetical protein